MRILIAGALLLGLLPASAQTLVPGTSADSDGDGLTDATEAALLTQFAPHFLVSGEDCSQRPAEFVPSVDEPQVRKEDGTIYGQASPRDGHAGQVELHYYHLWRKDCGEMSHPLDAEHVSALVARDSESWKALYWYAAAHEDTLCDASQIARAATIDGEQHGPVVWISSGKHASFLNEAICAQGCGGDRCFAMVPLTGVSVINLGERSSAMNGATWAGSAGWPLAEKMSRTDFTDARLARVDRLPVASIAWANPGKPGMKSTIRVAGTVRGSTAGGLNATGVALDTAQANTGDALGTASGHTGKSLAKSARSIVKALRTTARKLGIVE